MLLCVNKNGLWIEYAVFIVFLTVINESVGDQLRTPAVEFKRHEIVYPRVQHARTKREIVSTKGTGGEHHKEVTVYVEVDGKEYLLDLVLNEELVPGNHVISYQKNGETVLQRPEKELDVCQYSGTVRGRPGSWVALSTCHGIRGVIHDGDTVKYMEPAEDNTIDSRHYIYDHSDLTTSHRCGYNGDVTNNKEYDPELMKTHLHEKKLERSRVSRYKRSENVDPEFRGPYNASRQSRYVELVLVADNREFEAHNKSMEALHRNFKDIANIVNSVFMPLDIYIALVGVVVWNEKDEVHIDADGDKTLTNFLHYRKVRLQPEIPNDNAILITRQSFNGNVIGKTLKGTICTNQFSGGTATDFSGIAGLVATNVAHGLGHSLGMEHDEPDCECPDDQCIMNRFSTPAAVAHWSSCSLQALASAFKQGMDYCLRNKPARLFASPTCGNGFVEAGEQCDCGLSAAPACAACCDPATCSLRANATCAVGACCDHSTCQLKSAGTECRSAERECDLPEYCTGHSEYCPRDVYKMDTTQCAYGNAYCMHGSCRTHTDQCKLLWGSTGESSDLKCYNSNVKGTWNGNCGYAKEQHLKCAPEDVLCGKLQCRRLNDRLAFGLESVSRLTALFLNSNGTIIPCITASIDLGLNDVEPGLVPDGAKCGDDKMCFKQKCVTVQSVREDIGKMDTSICPTDCFGHGVCNSEGHCHCERGFAPPTCSSPGPGGSVDSGPATDNGEAVPQISG